MRMGTQRNQLVPTTRKAPVCFFWPLITSATDCSIALSEAQVRKELAEEEASRLQKGGMAMHSTSASAFLVMGLELEDNQCVYNTLLLRRQLIIT